MKSIGSNVYDQLRVALRSVVADHDLGEDEVVVTVPLTADQAIGNPEDKDYPIITGREKMMQAVVRNTPGQAFTDMYGEFSARLGEIVEMPLPNNFRRAIFVATLNAVLRHVGLIGATRHCRDQGPTKCAPEVVDWIRERYGEPRVLLVGLQPRLVEHLAPVFPLRVTDLDQANIGQERFGVTIEPAEKAQEILDWCDLTLVTGTTLVNNTIGPFLERARKGKPTVFYGVTIVGAAKLLGLDHMCPQAD
ncbi:MAG: hypothetical protein H5T84_09165 [Thermoleophilia bacterium]|nr:hypothetical protein [Thermoleophilia bacterium]